MLTLLQEIRTEPATPGLSLNLSLNTQDHHRSRTWGRSDGTVFWLNQTPGWGGDKAVEPLTSPTLHSSDCSELVGKLADHDPRLADERCKQNHREEFGVRDVRFLPRYPHFLPKPVPRGLGSGSPEAVPEAGAWEHSV